MNNTTLGGRLLSVAGFVRQGAVFADVGTDHAHLPIFLLQSGKIERAVCSDINSGPLKSARANVNAAGLSDRVDFVLTDGCEQLMPYGATDYAICGMGGELIADIVTRSECLKRAGLRLILQPMTKQATLRLALANGGFSVIDEIYSTEDGKHYLCLACEYDGVLRELDPAKAEVGLENIKNVNINSQILYFDTRIKAYQKRIKGLFDGGIDTRSEELVLDALLERRAAVEALSKRKAEVI